MELSEGDAGGQVNPDNEYSHEMYGHQYYVIPGLTDVSKMREEAERAKRGDYYAQPSRSVLHHHRVREACEGREHETFDPEEGTQAVG